ncbi:MAG: uroporphyrinogen-III synthase [Betaproteobacteria bacterium]|nr:uroporphyrinogen-III synthase [Betaproteobacteria bacterium]
MIEEAGAVPVLFPTIEIEPIELHAGPLAILRRMDQYEYAIFVSANAARYGMAAVRAHGSWPANLTALAVGDATAQALREQGLSRVLAPTEGSDSESLLRIQALQNVQDKNLLVVRGLGGRELLAGTLRERGARVDYLECYRRLLPASDPAPVLQRFAQGNIQAVVINSAEGLENLFTLLGEGGYAYLCAAVMFVMHPKIAARAREKGVKQVIVTPPGDEALARGLITHFAAAP